MKYEVCVLNSYIQLSSLNKKWLLINYEVSTTDYVFQIIDYRSWLSSVASTESGKRGRPGGLGRWEPSRGANACDYPSVRPSVRPIQVSIQHLCRNCIDTVSMQYRYCIDTVSILYRYCIDPVSILYRYCIDTVSCFDKLECEILRCWSILAKKLIIWWTK